MFHVVHIHREGLRKLSYKQICNIHLSPQVVSYPPPPPVATGPGLDRPLFTPSPEYVNSLGIAAATAAANNGGGANGDGHSANYTMMRTRKFYEDQLDNQQKHPTVQRSQR